MISYEITEYVNCAAGQQHIHLENEVLFSCQLSILLIFQVLHCDWIRRYLEAVVLVPQLQIIDNEWTRVFSLLACRHCCCRPHDGIATSESPGCRLCSRRRAGGPRTDDPFHLRYASQSARAFRHQGVLVQTDAVGVEGFGMLDTRSPKFVGRLP